MIRITMEELRTTQDYFRFVNRIFKIIENPNEWKNVELGINTHMTFKDYLMLYYNTIETNIQKVIPFHFYKGVLQTLPLFPHKNGYIYKCDNCGFYMVLNPATRKKISTRWEKPPLLCGFYDPKYLNSYIGYYIQNRDTVNRLPRKIDITDNETYNMALFCHYHVKYASKECTHIEVNRFKGFTDSYHSHRILERVCVQNHTKNPITQYLNLISLVFPFLRNSRYIPNAFDLEEIHRYCQLYLSRKRITNSQSISGIFAVFTLLVTNKLMTKEKLSERLTMNREKYPNLTGREVSNIFGISFNSILQNIKPIITTILEFPDFFP